MTDPLKPPNNTEHSPIFQEEYMSADAKAIEILQRRSINSLLGLQSSRMSVQTTAEDAADVSTSSSEFFAFDQQPKYIGNAQKNYCVPVERVPLMVSWFFFKGCFFVLRLISIRPSFRELTSDSSVFFIVWFLFWMKKYSAESQRYSILEQIWKIISKASLRIYFFARNENRPTFLYGER